MAWPLRPSETYTDAPLRASFQTVTPPSTAPPATAGLSRGWYGLPTASPGANCLPSMPHRAVKRPSRTLTTQATACSPRYLPRRRRQYRCIKAGTERLKNSFNQVYQIVPKLNVIGDSPNLLLMILLSWRTE